MKTVLNTMNINTRTQPLFLGESLSLQRYDQLKYPKLYELAEMMEEYFWSPKEIPLMKDRNDYHELSEAERFVFDTNLKWQTMTDSMLSRSLFKVAEHVSNPELEAAMNVWAFFESNIHSRSYSHILKNVYPDESVFWDSILQDQEVVSRANEAKREYDKLFGAPACIKTQIFDALLATQITEGLAFYTSFVCSFFFGARGKMEGNAKIIKLIARDENLHLAATQHLLKILPQDDEDFIKIREETKEQCIKMFVDAADQEKAWADYLFKDGSMIGLNKTLLNEYVEWITNRRLQAVGLPLQYKTGSNPLPWTQKWISGGEVQVAPQETQITSYIVGGVKKDVSTDSLKGLAL